MNALHSSQVQFSEMGISVSVDSWFEQSLTDLVDKPFRSDDPIFHGLVSPTTSTSEIFLIESDLIKQLVYSNNGNLEKVIQKCLESLISNEVLVRNNAAAILSRIFPFMCSPNAPQSLMDYLLANNSILGERNSPGEYIVHAGVALLASSPASTADRLIDAVESNLPVIDLTAFVVFALQTFYGNQTLHHCLLVECEKRGDALAGALLNYVHVGGRAESPVSLLFLLLFHPSADYLNSARRFVSKGGALSRALCRPEGGPAACIGFIASLALSCDLSGVNLRDIADAGLMRLALAKLLLDNDPPADPAAAQHAWRLTHSPLAKAVATQMQQPAVDVPLLGPFAFTAPVQSDGFRKWAHAAVPQLFLLAKSLWMVGTETEVKLPDFTQLDSLVMSIDA